MYILPTMSWHCSNCKVVLTDENGYRRKSGDREGDFTGTCKPCSVLLARKWCRGNREKVAARAKKAYHANPEKLLSRLADRRRKLNLLKMERPCYDCGGTFDPECMEWDHLPDKEKCFEIGRGPSYPLARVMDEIAKCQLVCCNCHSLRTIRRRRESRKPLTPA